jgi:hypothetical protein
MSRMQLTLTVFGLLMGCAPAPEAPHTTNGALLRNPADTERTSEGLNEESSEELSEEQSDIEWANQFFVTQVYDARWNPDGLENDLESNNCGPASLAMVMTTRGDLPADLNAETAIDHARATMYAGYPEIDAAELFEDAHLYQEQNRVCVDDDTHPVYFDEVHGAASIAQGIENGGGQAVFGYSWREIDTMLQTDNGVIAHGHITETWRSRFNGEYAQVGEGAIPHFIALFRASTEGDVIVSDPMYRGGAVVMNRDALKAFFGSPVNVYDTAIRVVSWADIDTTSSTADTSESFEIAAEEWRSFSPITIDENSTLVLTMTGTGDADLYARQGAMPTEDAWDCRPFSPTSDEQCRLRGEGTWYTQVRGYASATSVVTLTAAIKDHSQTGRE